MGVQQTPSVVEASLGVNNSSYGYQGRNEQTSSTALCEQNSPFLFHPDLKLDTKEIKNWVRVGGGPEKMAEMTNGHDHVSLYKL